MKKQTVMELLLILVGCLVSVLLFLNLAQGGVWIVRGLDGANGQNGTDGANGADGEDGEDGKNGEDGLDGKSAYELALEDGFVGSLHEWLLSLAVRGGDGEDGKDGQNGTDGEDGKDGTNGKDGVGVADVHISSDGRLIVTLTDGTLLDAGVISEGGVDMGEPDADGFTPVYEMVVKGEGDLNLRDVPGTGNVVTVVSEGDTLLRTGIQRDDPENGYSRFLYNGQVCYARSHYFSLRYNYEGNLPVLHLPDSILLTLGEQAWFITDQIVSSLDEGLTVRYSYTGGGERVYDGSEGFAITPSEVGSFRLNVSVEIVENGRIETVAQSFLEVKVVEKREALSLTGLILGDSRISDGEIVKTLAKAFPGITWLGTRRTSDGETFIPHEGRGGWSAENYATDPSVTVGEDFTLENPFYDPATGAFSFAYYMSQFYPAAVPDFVVINLGANDGYSESSVAHLDAIVESIRAFGTSVGKSIRVLVMTEYRSPAEGYYLTQSSDASLLSLRQRQFAYFDLLSEAFGEREEEGVYLLPNYLAINGFSDRVVETVETANGEEKRITDVIHLGSRGYIKEAAVIRAYLYAIFA